MGKETIGQKRAAEFIVPTTNYADKIYIDWIITQEWSNLKKLANAKDISEDNNIDVILKTQWRESNLILSGIKCVKNSYLDLLKLLKKERIISNNQMIRVFIKKLFLWEKIDIENDMFDAGDKILIMIFPIKRKCIRKIRQK